MRMVHPWLKKLLAFHDRELSALGIDTKPVAKFAFAPYPFPFDDKHDKLYVTPRKL